MQEIPQEILIPKSPEEWQMFSQTFYYFMAGLGALLAGLATWFKFFRKEKK
jgi:LPXTG-motif cell wall-anchored protein